MRTLRTKLLISLISLFTGLGIVAGAGWYTAQIANTGLASIFNDRVKPLRDLKVVSDLYAVNIVDTAHKVRNGNLDWVAGMKEVEEARSNITKRWESYAAANFMDDNEKRLGINVDASRQSADAAATELVEIFRGHDKSSLDRFVLDRLYQFIDPITDAVGKLVDLQIDAAFENYAASSARFDIARKGMIAAFIGSAIAFSFALWTTVVQAVRPLTAMTGAMAQLAAGNLEVVLPGLGRRDEIGAMAQAMEGFKAKAREKAQQEAEAKVEQDRRAANRQRELEKNANEQIQKQKMQLDMAVTNMSQGLLMFDSSARIVICNQRFVQMYGLLPEVVKPGCTLQQLVDHRKAVGSFTSNPREYVDEILTAIAQGNPSNQTVETGNGRTIQITNQPMQDGGWVETHEDITERRKAEAKISHMALHDALTSLPNRLFFREQMEDRLAHLGRDEKFAVLCLDLDQFKSVNDTLGHPLGDKLLRQVGERLRGCLGEGDTVARLGGDEFAILQSGTTEPTETTLLMARLIEVIGKPFDLDGHQVVIGVSIGVTLAPTGGADPDQLLKNADMALYRAKAGGRGTYRFFEPEMDARMQARRTLELDLRNAIINGEFEVYYQPLVNLKTEQIAGFEALIRWNHPQRGLVQPLDFIPLAEETGLIAPIGEWILRQACKEASQWPSNISIAVNLSPMQFKTPNLSQTVVNALAHSGLAANRLQLEITESVLLFDSEPTLDTLHQLRALGVRISMDDFGTGYSSLSYLRSFPFDKIKIDRSFVHDVCSNMESMAIIRAVSGLGCSLGMSTTGEGIETREELDFLKREGCIEGQGYLFGRPQPAKEIFKLLAEQAFNVEAVA